MGVLPHSEINYEDVIKVLEIVQGYAPSIDVERELVVPDQSGGATTIRLEDKQYAVTLVGGGSADCCPNSWRSKDPWQLRN